MTVQDEAKAKARAQTVSAIEERTAIYLKKSWSLVGLAARKLNRSLPADPTDGLNFTGAADDEARQKMRDAEWMRLGKQLIDQGKITIAGVEGDLYIEQLDGVMDEQIKKSLNIRSFKMLVPSRRQTEVVADTVANGVGRSTGSGIGFLDDLLGGASLGDMFRGLFSWIFSGFDGGFDGLKQTIAGFTGDRMRQTVVADLTQLRTNSLGTTEDISGFMTPDIIGSVGAELAKAPGQSLKGAPAPDPLAAIRATAMGGIDDDIRKRVEGEVRTGLFNAIGEGFKANSQFKDLYKDKDDGIWTTVGSYVESAREMVGYPGADGLKRATLDKVQFEVAAKLASVVVNPDFTYQGADTNLKGKHLRDMEPAARAQVLADEARKVIEELGKKPGVRNPDFYALLQVTLPTTMAEKIIEAEKGSDDSKKLPWYIAGDISKTLVRAESAVVPRDTKAEAQAGRELVADLQKQISGQLMQGGKLTEAGEKLQKLAGAPLNDRHTTAMAEALSPVMLRMALPAGAKEITDSPKGVFEEVASRFREALRKSTKINDPVDPSKPGVALSPEALDVIADKMALSYAETVLKKVPAATDSFPKEAKAREDLAVKTKISGELSPVMETYSAELDSMMNPQIKAAKKKMEPADRALLTGLIADGIRPFAMKPDFLNDVQKPDAYAKAHDVLSEGIFRGLKQDTTHLLTDAGMQALAQRAAAEYINRQAGVATPPDVLKAMAATEKAATADIIGKTAVLMLREEASYNAIKAANNGADVKVEEAAEAVKMLAAERLMATAKFAKLDEAGYTAFAREVRGALEGRRKAMGIVEGKEGDALLNVMAYRMTTGIVENGVAAPAKAPVIPAKVKELRNVGEGVLAEQVIPQQVRDLLMPKLKGTVSAGSDKLDDDNVIIANLLAMDATQSGLSINREKLMQNVSDVILYQKLKADQTGKPVDEAEMRQQLIGAMSGRDVGMGARSITTLADVISTRVKVMLDNPDAPAADPAKAAKENHELAERMAADIYMSVYMPLRERLKTDPAASSLSEEQKEAAAVSAAEAVVKVARHKMSEKRDEVPFAQETRKEQKAMMQDMLGRQILGDLKAKFGGSSFNNVIMNSGSYFVAGKSGSWKEDVAESVSAGVAGTLVAPETEAERLNAWGAKFTTDDKSLFLPWKREELAAGSLSAVKAFQSMRRQLAPMMPSVRAMDMAIDSFEERFKGGATLPEAVVKNPEYREKVKALLISEAAAVKAGGVASPDLRVKHEAVMAMRDAFVKQQARTGEEALQGADAWKAQAVTGLRYVTVEDHIMGNPENETVKAIVSLRAMMAKQQQAYDADVKALGEKDKPAYDEAKHSLASLKESVQKGTATPADLKKYDTAQGVADAYLLRRAQLDEQQGKATEAMWRKLKDLYAQLPDGEKAPEKVRLAAAERFKAEMDTPQARNAFTKAFEQKLDEMHRAIGRDGIAAVLSDMDFRMGEMRRQMAPALAEDPRNPLMPLTVATMVVKAEYAYPNLNPVEREEKIRSHLPEWAQMKPEKIVAGVTEADKALSPRVKEFLVFMDQTDLLKVQEKGVQKIMFLNDKKIPGFAAPSGQARELPQIFLPSSFATEAKVHDMGGGFTFTIEHLTQDGKKDLVDMAAVLQRRKDAAATPEDKEKYGKFLKDLQEVVKARVKYYARQDDLNASWKEVSGIISDEAKLAAYGKGELKLALTTEAAVVAALPETVTAMRVELEKDLNQLGGMSKVELAKALAERRGKLGFAADGKKLDEKALVAQGGVLPEAERVAASPKSPVTPENLREKMALAFPELSPLKREEKVRQTFKQWAEVKPASGMAENFAKMDEARAPKVKELLSYIDKVEVFTEGSGATARRFMFDDLDVPGFNSRHSGLSMPLPDVINSQAFAVDWKTFKVPGRRDIKVADLTEKGMQEVIDTAVALKQRIDTPGISAEDKSKYTYFLERLTKLTGDLTASGKRSQLEGLGWAKAHGLISNPAMLAEMAKPATKLALPGPIAFADPQVWLGTMMKVDGTGRPDSAAALPAQDGAAKGVSAPSAK